MAKSNPRQAYGETLAALGEKDERIVALEADLGKSTMSCLFGAKFPNRYFEMGIAEANMTSFAAGLALMGKIAFTNSFAVFAGGRSYDQIRQGICTAKLNVKIIGSSAGLSDFGDGATHQSVEDIAIMRAIPNMTVLVPMDAIETRKMTEYLVQHEGPAYMRLSRNDMEEHYPEDKPYEPGKPLVIKEGKEICIFACGVMVQKAVEAALKLDKEGISAKVVNVSTLKPFPDEAIAKLAAGCRGVVTAEEHSLIGGLGSAICSALSESRIPIKMVGIKDVFGQSASTHEELLDYYGLTVGAIEDACKALIQGAGK